jgi:nucleolar protein 14
MKLKKGNKRGKSDAIHAKKSKVIEKKQNPFELHVNREKFNIMNRKRNHSLGQPLVSRQKAFENRKQTLGAEYNVRNKANSFEDRRRAGYRKLPKESIYNLNDSEVLTHRGQTLGEIEQFNDFVPDNDDEMSDEEARLDGNYKLKPALLSLFIFIIFTHLYFSKIYKNCAFWRRRS